MTNFFDALYQGQASFTRSSAWNGTAGSNGIPTATNPNDTQIYGVPHTQTVAYEIGTASTALASGIFFSASGATGAGTLTSTGALVSAGVATLDVPRCIRFTASVDLSTNVFTIRGTDGYGQALTWSGVGPTGNTLGNTGSFVDSLSAFKTVTTASAVGGSSTTAFLIGTSNTFGLPYRVANKGKGLDLYIDGGSATISATLTAGFSASGATPTATTADVRGTVAVATAVLPNDTRFFTYLYIAPPVGLSPTSDTTAASYGATPFSN